MLALVLSLLAAPAAHLWTVDDDGRADFTQISDAIAQVLPGDTLLVEPGTYTQFTLHQRLTILGRPGPVRPHVTGLCNVFADSFTLAGLDFNVLSVSGASGRGRIDDCRVGYAGDGAQTFAVNVNGCAHIVLSRTDIKGSKNYSQAVLGAGGAGMQIVTSNVTLVGCDLVGAKGHDATEPYENGGTGGTALRVADGSHVVVVASSIVGGFEGWGGYSPFYPCVDGPSGKGLEMDQSFAVLRGAPSSSCVLKPGGVDGVCTNEVGPSLVLNEGSTVVLSGNISTSGDVFYGGGVLIQPAVPEPLIVVDGPDDPGAHKTIQLCGPPGANCLLAASFAPDYVPLAQFDDKLWVGLSGAWFLVPLVTAGQNQPVVLGFHVPPSLAGLEGVSIELQPFFPGLASDFAPGKSTAGNVAEIILRF